MAAYLLRRVVHSTLLLLALTFFVFLLIHLAPSDPAHVIAGLRTGDAPTQEQVREVRAAYGLEQPLPVQYGRWLLRIAHGDLGDSIRTGRSVRQELAEGFGYSLRLGTLAMLVTVLVGLTTGLIAALVGRGVWDNLLRGGALVLVSTPDFWLAFLLIMVFSVQLGWLPSFGARGGWHFVLPVVTLAAGYAARLSRLTRSILLEQLCHDYLRTARAKGLHRRTILLRHVLPNLAAPLATVLAYQFAGLISGAIIVETVFSLPGLGNAYAIAVTYRDLPMIQATVLTFTVIILVTNLLADLTCGLVDPRIRLTDRQDGTV